MKCEKEWNLTEYRNKTRYIYIYISIPFQQHSQTWANGHLQITTIRQQRLPYWGLVFNFYNICKASSEQRLPVNNDHKFGVSRVVVVHRFDCTYILKIYYLKISLSYKTNIMNLTYCKKKLTSYFFNHNELKKWNFNFPLQMNPKMIKLWMLNKR